MGKAKASGPKLPAQQLAILAIARFAEPLALTSVFPYLPEMIEGFGVDKDNVAKWAGLVGAIFSLTQSLTAVPWGRASDRFGRKPIILFGLASTMICFVVWGFSSSLIMALVVRAIQGGGNGNVGIIRTMVAEMVPQKELQPKAFSIMPLVWSIGSIFGPSFGGFFARPADQYPSVFGNSELFKQYPFLLPNLVACGVFLISVAAGALFLEETLETKRHKRDWGLVLGEKLTQPFRKTKPNRRRHGRPLVDDEASAPLLTPPDRLKKTPSKTKTPPPPSPRIFTAQVVINLISYTGLAIHSVAADQLLPVFLSYPRPALDPEHVQLPFRFAGGFDMSSNKIGTVFTVYGIACGLIQFLLFPPLCNRFGVLRCFRVTTMIFPLVYLALPYTALVQNDTARYAALLGILLVKGFGVIVGFPSCTIMLTNSATSLRILGTLNGYATLFSGLGRAAGPAAAGAAFTWGVQNGYVITPWWLLGTMALLAAIPAWFIVEGDGPAREADSEWEDEDEEEEDDNNGVEDGISGPFALSDDEEGEDVDNDEDEPVHAGKIPDAVNAANYIPSPENSENEEPDMPLKRKMSWSAAKRPPRPAREVRLRRMSTTGEDLEHDMADADWQSKQSEEAPRI